MTWSTFWYFPWQVFQSLSCLIEAEESEDIVTRKNGITVEMYNSWQPITNQINRTNWQHSKHMQLAGRHDSQTCCFSRSAPLLQCYNQGFCLQEKINNSQYQSDGSNKNNRCTWTWPLRCWALLRQLAGWAGSSWKPMRGMQHCNRSSNSLDQQMISQGT